MPKRKYSESGGSESMSNSENEMLSSDEERSLSHITNNNKICVEDDSGDRSTSSNDARKQRNKYRKSCKGSSDEDEVPEINYSSSKRQVKKSKHLISDTTDSDDEILLSELKKPTSERTYKALSVQNHQELSCAEEMGHINNTAKASENKSDMHKKASISSYSSDDEPLAVKSKISLKKLEPKEKVESEDGFDVSSDEEPLNKLAEAKVKPFVLSSSSDDESFAIKSGIPSNQSKVENRESKLVENIPIISSDEEMPISKIVEASKKKLKSKINSVSCSSDDEPLAAKSKKSANPLMSKKDKQKMNDSNNLSSDEDEPLSKVLKTSNMKEKPRKSQNSSNDRVEHIKKYMRVAGIHIKSYDKLFEDCKSVKSKVEKLINVLHENGLKGRPTLEKCKKLRKRIETKREIAELDTSNIIKTEGRPRRGTNSTASDNAKKFKNSPAEKRFSRLKDIIDSEESD